MNTEAVVDTPTVVCIHVVIPSRIVVRGIESGPRVLFDIAVEGERSPGKWSTLYLDRPGYPDCS